MTAARMRALLCGLCVAGQARAEAGDADAKRIDAMLARAVSSYDTLEFEAARSGLDEALAAAAAAGLDQAPVAARVHVALAVVWVGGMRDRYRGFQEMLTAVRIDPAVEIDPALATLETQELLQSARDVVAAQRATRARPDARPGAVRDERGLVHERIDDAWAGFDIPLRCEIGPDVPATRVVLFYRAAGHEDFQSVPMKERDGAWSASIPEAATGGKTLHYYLEARDRRGRAVAQDGSAASPNLIAIRGLNPRSPSATPTVSARRRALGKRWTAGLGVGSGVGVLGAGQSEHCGANRPRESGCTPIDENHAPIPVNSGAAASPLHLLADVGYRLTPAWEVAAQLRLQVISGHQVKDFDDKSFLGTARIRRWFGAGRTRMFFAGALGGGQVTHAVALGPDGGNVRDTLTSGKLALGGGLGLAHKIAGGLAVIGALDALVLLPDNTAFHADLNLGLRYEF